MVSSICGSLVTTFWGLFFFLRFTVHRVQPWPCISTGGLKNSTKKWSQVTLIYYYGSKERVWYIYWKIGADHYFFKCIFQGLNISRLHLGYTCSHFLKKFPLFFHMKSIFGLPFNMMNNYYNLCNLHVTCHEMNLVGFEKKKVTRLYLDTEPVDYKF